MISHRALLIIYLLSTLSLSFLSYYYRDKKGVNLEYVLGCSLTSTEPERSKFIEALTCSGERYHRPVLVPMFVRLAFDPSIYSCDFKEFFNGRLNSNNCRSVFTCILPGKLICILCNQTISGTRLASCTCTFTILISIISCLIFIILSLIL